MQCERKALRSWATEARLADLKYHRTRRTIWDKLIRLIKATARDQDEDTVDINDELFTSLKSGLTARSENMNDASRLSLETALVQILEASGGAHVEVREEKEEKGEGLVLHAQPAAAV